MFRTAYVFDYREAEGYVFKGPAFIVKAFCRTRFARNRALDWWWTPEGQ
jgi:hypothetical protein